MKIPGLNLYVLTETQMQAERIKVEKATRLLTNKQINILLADNARLRQKINDQARRLRKLNLN